MAKKKKKNEQPAEPEPEQEQRELPKLPKERNPLLTVLTILLVLAGVGELALWGYFGFASFQASSALRRYEAEQQAAAEERAAQGIVSGSAYGPSLKVENGQVTWRLEEDEDIDPTAGGTASPAQNGGGQTTPSTGLIRFPKVPYALAEQDTESSSQRTAAAGDGTGTLT